MAENRIISAARAFAAVALIVPGAGLPIQTALAQGAAQISAIEAAMGPGWRCALLPDGLKPPGSVYRITKQGVIFHAADFSKRFKTTTAPASVGSFTSAESYDFALVAALTGLKSVVGSAEMKAHAAKKYAFSVVVAEATKEITQDDDPARAAVKKWFATIDRDPNSAYFLVREAVLAKSVTYHFGQDFAAAVAAQAQARSFLKGKLHGSLSSSEGFLLSQDYPSPVRVCLLPEQLTVGPAFLKGTSLTESNIELRLDSRHFKFSNEAEESPPKNKK